MMLQKLFQKLLKKPALGFALILAISAVQKAQAAKEVIEFPEEELAAESVLPVFDDPVSVKNRTIKTAKRLEVGLLGGQSLLEPFYNPFYFGLTGAYHINEDHGINVVSNFYLGGLSNNGESLNRMDGVTPVKLQYAPAPKYLILGNYQYTGFYGKISLSKDFVMNLSVYGLGGLGFFGIGDGIKPALNFGLGQKFYFSPNFALRVDLTFLTYLGPNVLSNDNLSNASSPMPASSFEDKMFFSYLLSVGAVYVLPEF